MLPGRCGVVAGFINHPNSAPASASVPAPALTGGQPSRRTQAHLRLPTHRHNPPLRLFKPSKSGSWPTLSGKGAGRVSLAIASWICHAVRQPSRRPPLRLQTRPEEADPTVEAAAVAAEAALPGVVRVQCVQDLPRFDLPLLLGTFRSSVCNAVAVSYCGQSYLLAPAACVSYGSQVRVMMPGRDKPFPARVQHLGLDCELAALAVDAPDFWEALVPYELAPYGLPHLQQPVDVVSYAAAQPRPRTSAGTVMRTEVMTYPSAMQRLLGLAVAVALSKEQLGSALVDSKGLCLGLVFGRTVGKGGGGKAAGGGAMGGGNSGGNSGGDERWGQGRRRVGRRRGRRGQTEASALVVPVPVVTHFLEDIRSHGRFLGFPTLGIQWKRTESAALRRYTGLTHDQTGVAIMSVNPTAALAAHAQPLDVLAAVGVAAVGNDGTVPFRGGAESINISYHISQFQVGASLELTLIRGGLPRNVSLLLGVPHRLLPLHLGGRAPQYLVVSGLVMTALSTPFLEGAFGRTWAVRAPVQLLREWHNHPATEDEQVVVVAECQDMGPGSGTDGYERRAVMHQTVVRCNGVPVRNMRHLAVMVAEAVAATGANSAASGGSGSGGGSGSRRRRSGGDGSLSSVALGDGGGDVVAAPAAAIEAREEDPRPGVGSSGASSRGESDADGSRSGSESETGSGSAPEERLSRGQQQKGGGEPAEAADGTRLDPQNLILELSNRMILVLPVRQAVEDTQAMLAEYDVHHAVSEDLRPAYDSALQLGRGAAAGGGGGGRGSGSVAPGRGRGGVIGGRPRWASGRVEAGADGSGAGQ